MKFALGVPLMHRGEDNAFLSGEAVAGLAQAAEKAGYDALYILTNAIKAAGSLDRKAIRDHIATTKQYAGVSGVITMGPDRDPIKPVAMIKIDGGTTHFAGWVRP